MKQEPTMVNWEHAPNDHKSDNGIGKSLLTRIIKLLERRQIRRIKVEVHYKCSSVILFYYVFGFRFAGCVRDRFGKGEDATTLVKEVS